MNKPEPLEPDWVIRPGELLKEELVERGIPPRMLKRACGLTDAEVEGLFTGETEITEQTAQRLGHFLGTSGKLWRNLETAYRCGLAAGK